MEHKITVFVGPANERLGAEVCQLLGVKPGAYECARFPDGEMQMDVRESVRGCDVVILQSTSPPVERHLLELLLLADACRRAGANRLTAVVPYFGYARQDRRSERRSLGARVIADAMATGGFDRLMLIDAHTAGIEGFFAMPIDHLTAIPVLARAIVGAVRDDSVVVAPDFGAVKRAREFAKLLQLPMAFVHKTRLTGETVETQGVIGRVSNRAPILVDDMISTGGTIEAAVTALRAAGAIDPITVVTTHALLVGDSLETLGELGLSRLVASNTVSFVAPAEPHVETVSVAALIATAIARDHRGESLVDLRVTT